MSLSTQSAVLVALLGMATIGSARARAQATKTSALAPAGSVRLQLPLLALGSAAGEAGPGNRPALVVSLTGKSAPVVLPMAADTHLWKEDKKTHGGDGNLIVRDNRFSQALFLPDLSALPKGAAIQSARFQIRATWREREGAGTLTLHRMLVPWSEQATWAKPFPDKPDTWNGLRPGVHFEAAPFATLRADDFRAGVTLGFDGLGPALGEWASGARPHHGFVALLSGKVLHLNLDSREAKPQKRDAVTVGGAERGEVVLRVDVPLLRRALLAPGDVREADLWLKLANKTPPGDLSGVRVDVYAGSSAGGAPLASAPLAEALAGEEGWLRVPVPAPALQKMAADGTPPGGDTLRLTLTGAGAVPAPPVAVLGTDAPDAKGRPWLALAITEHPKARLFDHAVKPTPGVYTVLKDGHLSYGGRRLRLWGMVGYDRPDRLRKMGFNAQRVWNPTSQAGGGSSEAGGREFYTVESAKRGEPAPFAPGDGSKLDGADKHFAALKEHGMFVMFAALTGTLPIKPLLADDSFVAGGPDWAAWKEAMSSAKDSGFVARYAIYFDERLQTIKKRHAANLLNHVNPYTGKKVGEDEAIAIYEVWNEQGFLKRALENGLGLPKHFTDKAQRQWNEWLRARYRDEAGLKAAWGSLKDGESLAGGTITLAPILKERADYPKPRASDHVRFLIEKVEAFHRDFKAHCRAQAPAGVGVNVAPFSFDTQYKPSIHWPYASAGPAGEVNSFGMYYWDLTSQLGRPPGMYVIDAHQVEGRATVLYETNQARPGPHRTEYPLRLAALAAWQDFDGVFWHYWGAGDLDSDEKFLTAAMPHVARGFPWTGAHHEADPVMTSAMAIAGRIFLSGAVKQAPTPTTFRIGKEGLYSLDLVNGVDARKETFARGSRLRFEPNGDFQVIAEGASKAGETETGALASGDEIVWDYANGRLLVDTPTAKVYVGKTAPSHRFKDGITLSGFSTPFIAWALVSADGKPLVGPAATGRAFVTSQFNAENTGFQFDWSVAGGPDRQAEALKNRGRAPAIVDQADYTLSFPTRLDYTFRGYDFALRQNVAQPGQNVNVVRVQDREIWMGVLDIARRLSPAAPVIEAGTLRPPRTQTAGGRVGSEPKLAGVFNPLPNLSWGDTYAQAHKTLRDAAFVKTSVSPEAKTPAPAETITLTEADVFLNTPADIEVRFAGGAMRSIGATFKRPPVLREAVAALEKQLGPATEKTLDKAQFETSRARWLVTSGGEEVEVALSESQGIVTLVYTLRPKG